MITNPSSDQQALNTLNLYCATNSDALPAPAQLPWNWLDTPADGSAFDGAMAFKFATINNYFKSILVPYVAGNCYLPSIPFDGEFYAPVLTSGQTPQTSSFAKVTEPSDNQPGATIQAYKYQSPVISNSSAGISMSLSSSFELILSCGHETIELDQQLIVQGNLDMGGGPMDISYVNLTVRESYAIKVDTKGYLLLDPTTTVTDKSNYQDVDPSQLPDFFQDVLSELANYMNSVVKGSLSIDPLNQLQKFVFPAGKTFMFSDAAMSNYGDLVAHIKFVENPL
jgi:hypothetical protein